MGNWVKGRGRGRNTRTTRKRVGGGAAGAMAVKPSGLGLGVIRVIHSFSIGSVCRQTLHFSYLGVIYITGREFCLSQNRTSLFIKRTGPKTSAKRFLPLASFAFSRFFNWLCTSWNTMFPSFTCYFATGEGFCLSQKADILAQKADMGGAGARGGGGGPLTIDH